MGTVAGCQRRPCHDACTFPALFSFPLFSEVSASHPILTGKSTASVDQWTANRNDASDVTRIGVGYDADPPFRTPNRLRYASPVMPAECARINCKMIVLDLERR